MEIISCKDTMRVQVFNYCFTAWHP